MPCKITNTSGHMVLLRLKSGQTIHLRPKEESAILEDADVRGNARLSALRDAHLITIDEVAAKSSRKPRSRAKKAKAKPARSRTEASSEEIVR